MRQRLNVSLFLKVELSRVRRCFNRTHDKPPKLVKQDFMEDTLSQFGQYIPGNFIRKVTSYFTVPIFVDIKNKLRTIRYMANIRSEASCGVIYFLNPHRGCNISKAKNITYISQYLRPLPRPWLVPNIASSILAKLIVPVTFSKILRLV